MEQITQISTRPLTESIVAAGQPIEFYYTPPTPDQTRSLSEGRSVYVPESDENLLRLVIMELDYRALI